MRFYVYMLASQRNGTLYVGITNDLTRSVWQHQNDIYDGFTTKYGVHRLVWFEVYDTMGPAVLREKRIKKWKRAWKINLIEKDNSGWSDLTWKITQPNHSAEAA